MDMCSGDICIKKTNEIGENLWNLDRVNIYIYIYIIYIYYILYIYINVFRTNVSGLLERRL